ncbi:conserved Plasmodium protein, unknown function [Plasmodium gallinaceum]|uniref:Cell division control protein 73 C-terminal domain-containing protein n=1 Tax=Plasmodium gallinaceum TaxID=5849 RepID=A0A1J1GKQ1_PLAGA|nr:conserved Plasmodium protein, unknown function [Plasmodium gallinaceum]CRG92976.1 conserved Plasmodium protein, unknown function [Plasmodium gallinaceum]
MDRAQLNLKILMKKFLSDEKEYIKFENKGNKDIIVFEKKNFYIYSDVLCGIESRKKEKYNIGDIYLFLCLPKNNYTYSYINSIGYKYISILERNKIIKIIEEDEDSDEIKVNFFIYDVKKKIDLHDYVDIEKEHIIKVELFNYENSEDAGGSEDNIEKKDTKINENEKNKIIKKEDLIVINKNNIENKQEKKLSDINKENNKSNEDNLISFENTRKICDSDKILGSLIFYFKNDYIYNSLYKMKNKSLRKKRKYNFVEEDMSFLEYDELMYYNINEINSIEEYDNELGSFEFIKKKCSLEKGLYNDKESNNKEEENICEKEEKLNDKYYHENSENQKNGDSIEKNNSIVKHYYENNFFQNIFFQNLDLYSLLKNTYFRKLPNEEEINKNVKLISENFYKNYMKFIENNHKLNSSNSECPLSESINSFIDINDEYIINKSLTEKDNFIFDWNTHDMNEEYENSVNKYKKLDYNHILFSLRKKRREFYNGKKSLEIMKNFNEHDKIILFHNLLAQYIYSLNNKKYYEQNKGTIDFVHNFINNLSHEEYLNIDMETLFLPDLHISFTDSDELSFELNAQDKCNRKRKKIEKENKNEEGNNIDSNDEKKEFMLRSFSENTNEIIDNNKNIRTYIDNFNLPQDNYIEIKNNISLNLSNLKLSEESINNNKELIKFTHVKEINFKNAYDIIGRNSCDFSRIYKFFEEELLKKSNIKNVYINGIKKNIIVDDNSKIITPKKTLKLIDEIHLKYKKRPIILIPKDNNIINKTNVESFFLHNNLNSTNLPMQSNSTNGIYDSLSIIYKMFNKSIKFLFIENDKISKFTEIDWKCVIAVILKPNESLKELLNEYPFQSLKDLFHTFKAFVFMYNDDNLSPDLLSHNNIEIIKLIHNNRKDDYIYVNKFWNIIEKFILQRRDKIFFFKKKHLVN